MGQDPLNGNVNFYIYIYFFFYFIDKSAKEIEMQSCYSETESIMSNPIIFSQHKFILLSAWFYSNERLLRFNCHILRFFSFLFFFLENGEFLQ